MTSLTVVVESRLYLVKAERLMNEAERENVINIVAANPAGGDLVKGGHGLRKLRIPLRGRGKRGGARVIYWFHSERYPAVLMTVFAKNEASDLSAEELKRLAAAGAAIVSQIGG